MTISSQTRKAGPYAGNNVADTFQFTFKVFVAADVLVVHTNSQDVESVLIDGTDYTVNLNPNQDALPGGDVVLTAPLPTGEKLTITSAVPQLQTLDLTNQGGFYPATINAALDRATILVQQVAEQASRAVKVRISSGDDPDALVAQITQDANDVRDIWQHAQPIANDLANVDIVANNISDVNTVSGSVANVNTTAASIADVNTTAASIASINTTAASIASVNTAATNIANVNTTATNIASVNTVAGNNANVSKVAAIDTSVTAVAAIDANVSVVAGNSANVTTVATNISSVNTVATNAVAIVDVSTNKTAILNAADKAQKWAENPEDTPVVPGQYSALHWAKKSESFAGGAIIGPASSTDGALVLFDGTDGKKGKEGPLLTTSATDATVGRVTKVGDFGLGKAQLSYWTDFAALPPDGLRAAGLSAATGLTNVPTGLGQTRTNHLGFGESSYPAGFVAQAGGVIAAYSTSAAPTASDFKLLHHTGNIKKALGSNDDFPISQKAVTVNLGRPTVTGSVTFTKSTNTIARTGIVADLKLEAGDVIKVTGSAYNNQTFSIDFTAYPDSFQVNYEHRNGTGGLSLNDEIVTCTIERVAKWYNAPMGLGRGWVYYSTPRSASTTYYAPANRDMVISVYGHGTALTGSYLAFTIGGVGPIHSMGSSSTTSGNYASGLIYVPAGASYSYVASTAATDSWWELR